MKLSIDDAILKKYDLSRAEVLYACLMAEIGGIEGAEKKLLERGYIVNRNGLMLLTPKFSQRVQNLLLESDRTKESPERISNLVVRLREIFPEGKKEGGPYYWRGNPKEIADKLQMFFKLFGKKYTDDEIIDATKRYVESFVGKPTFMYLLKYFILKNKREEGEVVQVSELLTYLENKDQTSLKQDWTSEIR